MLFEPGNADELAIAVRRMLDNPTALAEMRREARREFEAKYTGEANHNQMMSAYRLAIENASRRRELPDGAEDGISFPGQSRSTRRRSISLRVVTNPPRFESIPGMRESDSISDFT